MLFRSRLKPRNQEEVERGRRMGIPDMSKIYKISELAAGNVMFCATGVTPGPMLNGVRYFGGGAHTHSLVMRSETGTIRFIEATHSFDRKPRFLEPTHG